MLCLAGTEDEPIRVPDPEIADGAVDRTIAAWQAWSEAFSLGRPVARAGACAARSRSSCCSSARPGAIAAAATTSLPESLDGGKNWDYRFAWVRDLAYSVDAFLRFGLREEPHAAVSWVLKALKENTPDGMAVFLTLDGEQTDGVRHETAAGWRGIGPVVSGNQASGQLQLGVYADLIAIMRAYTADGNLLDGDLERPARAARRRGLPQLEAQGLGHVGAAGGPALRLEQDGLLAGARRGVRAARHGLRAAAGRAPGSAGRRTSA